MHKFCKFVRSHISALIISSFYRAICSRSALYRTLGMTVGRSSYSVVSELPRTCTVSSSLIVASEPYIVDVLFIVTVLLTSRVTV